MGLPSGFRDVESSCKGTGFIDVMGVVVDFMSPSPTKGTDWQCTFSVADHASGYEGQRVKIFAPLGNLPQIRGTGDVVILRQFKLTNFRGMILLSNHSSDWTVFPCHAIPPTRTKDKEIKIEHNSKNKSTRPTQDQLQYAIELSNLRSRGEWTSLSTELVPSQTTFSSGTDTAHGKREKFSLIKDVGADKFYDLIGQVVKMYSVGDRLDVYLTDYTENSLLYNYGGADEGGNNEPTYGQEGDEFGYLALPTRQKQNKDWRGPSGRFTIQVTLFHPHSSYTQSRVRLGDCILLRNVRVKVARDQRYSRLEGVLHTDRLYPEKIEVEKVSPESDERVKALLRRKRDFLTANDDRPTKKRGRVPEEDAKLSKSQKKKRAEKAKKEASKPSGGNTTALSAIPPVRLEPNKHVACMHPNQPTRTLRAVNNTSETHAFTTAEGATIALPFQNLLYRAKVRVVDFWPRCIADFAVRTSEFDCLADESSGPAEIDRPPSPSDCGSEDSAEHQDEEGNEEPSRRRWTWFFSLLLEDASSGSTKNADDRLVVHVADDDAVFLLNLDATNLRRHEERLEELREKMFILWGDLEERLGLSSQRVPLRDMAVNTSSASSQNKDTQGKAGGEREALGGKPFECCIKEYGARVGQGWERRFRMFGTSIN